MRQKGQAVVEFAFVVPFLILLFMGILYLGIMFMDYIQYSNAARAAARDIATQIEDSKRYELTEKINGQDKATLSHYASPLTNLYSAYWDVIFLTSDYNGKTTEPAYNGESTEPEKGVDVRVSISLRRGSLPPLLESVNLLPVDLKEITYKMRLEKY